MARQLQVAREGRSPSAPVLVAVVKHPTSHQPRRAGFATAGLLFGLFSLAACGQAHSPSDNSRISSDCGIYDSWWAAPEIASPRGRGATPGEAVAALADEAVDVGAVKADAETATVAVTRNGSGGVYELQRDGVQWVVVGGEGCAASGGAPIGPSDGACEPPPEVNDEAENGYLTYCDADLSAQIEYYYPE